MKHTHFHCFTTLFVTVALSLTTVLKAADARITVQVDKPDHAISPMLFGIFFEDINLSADGGIYPELVRNRSFEDADSLENWKVIHSPGERTRVVLSKGEPERRDFRRSAPNAPRPLIEMPLNAYNRKSLKAELDGTFAVQNDGFYGMNVVKGERYRLKVALRAGNGFNGPLTVRLISRKGVSAGTLAEAQITGIQQDWSYYTVELTPSETDHTAALEVTANGKGTLFMDMVSLMPVTTWKDHGLRKDLAESIDALRPRFMRFPGGCWVEGEDFAHMNHWKNTIGNIDTRTPLWNIWGYNATHGLGLHEYLQLAEDMHAEPLYCINAGVSHREVVPLDQMGQWIQDALDVLEYANGPVNSVWGAQRAKNGHPAPFNLKYLEIGNENGNAPYHERWKLIADAVHAKYPDVTLIANFWAGSYPKDPMPSMIDEHYYNNPDWFIRNAKMYDTYSRKGPKIFVGEYAVTSGSGQGNLRGAIGEAAWMTGLERNSDVVALAAYAPLFCNASHKRWPINLINYDSYRWFGLPSYYVQKMFAENQGTQNLPVTIENAPGIASTIESKGGMGLGTWNNSAEFKDLIVTDIHGKTIFSDDFKHGTDAWRKTGRGEWKTENGVLRQSAIETNVTAYAGDSTWTDYTITLKARKLSGENGFQIYFHTNPRGQRYRWDLGGYTNSVHMLESALASSTISAQIETGRWYEVKLEVRKKSVRGYLDGALVQELTDKTAGSCLFSSASRDEKSGDIIVKIVNSNPQAVKATINLATQTGLSSNARVQVLTSASPLDENTLEQPLKVIPKNEQIRIKGQTISRSFQGNSVTIIRIPTK